MTVIWRPSGWLGLPRQILLRRGGRAAGRRLSCRRCCYAGISDLILKFSLARQLLLEGGFELSIFLVFGVNLLVHLAIVGVSGEQTGEQAEDQTTAGAVGSSD